MTAKEEALRLVDKYSNEANEFGEVTEFDYDKQCALICVDEILKVNEKISLKDLSVTMQTNDILCQLTDNAMYWQEVKQEIKEL